MSEPVVHLKQVCFIRNDRPILNDISWRMERGQHWAILGANGSGKTTLLKIITGYEWATHGFVTVLGERFGQCKISSLRKCIGWVSSALSMRLPLHDTTIDVVASGLEASLGLYREFTENEFRSARQAMEQMNIAESTPQRFGLLSQGEQQRALIARALICKPELLILDEPCAGLDPVVRQKLLEDVGSMCQTGGGPAVILVTHHVEEILPWITHVLLLKTGQAVFQGTVEQGLTSEKLSETFECTCTLQKHEGSYSALWRGEG